jgi:hypothetical protein
MLEGISDTRNRVPTYLNRRNDRQNEQINWAIGDHRSIILMQARTNTDDVFLYLLIGGV